MSALVAQLYGTRPRGAYCDACTFIGAWQSVSALVAQLQAGCALVALILDTVALAMDISLYSLYSLFTH